MMILSIVSGLIFMLGVGTWYALRVGRKLNKADQFDSYKKTAGDINEFNRKEEEKLNEKSKVTGSKLDRIVSPWLRGRK